MSCIAEITADARPTTSVVVMRAARAQKTKPSPAVIRVVLKSASAIATTRCPPDFGASPRASPRASHRLGALCAARSRARTFSLSDKPHRPIWRVGKAASIHIGCWFFALHSEGVGPHLVWGKRHAMRRHLLTRVHHDYEIFSRALMAFDT